jgi:hypothetical protein
MNYETEADEDPFVELNITELRAMAALDPSKLLRWIEDSGSAFILGAEQFEDDPDRWGGLYRLTLNRNIELHFLPDFNTAMLDESELPQFCVMPDPLKADTLSEREMPSLKDDEEEEEKPKGVIFYLTPEDFEIYCQELQELVIKWDNNPMDKESKQSFPFLPESYFRDFDSLEWVAQKVLRHPAAEAQRRFDGRLGYPVTPPATDDLEDIPAPYITEEDDEEDWESLENQGGAADDEREDREQEWLEEQRRDEGY